MDMNCLITKLGMHDPVECGKLLNQDV